MGHKKPTLQRQVHKNLTDKYNAGKGTSKKDALTDGTAKDKIFTETTYKTYYRHSMYFIDWAKETHPDCKTLESLRPHVNEYLQHRVDQVDKNGKHLSAPTIHLETSALCKLYGISADDPNRFHAPTRRRADITRSRFEAARDRNFNEALHSDFVEFCRGTGPRRNALEKLEGRDLWTRDRMEREVRELQRLDHRTKEETKDLNALRDALGTFKDEYTYFVHYRGDKGGRSRYSPIIGEHTDDIVKKFESVRPGEKVWERLPDCDIHSYRDDYARSMYDAHAEDIDKLKREKPSQVYSCRKDLKGVQYDRKAMKLCSKALGHNRINVVADHYLKAKGR